MQPKHCGGKVITEIPYKGIKYLNIEQCLDPSLIRG